MAPEPSVRETPAETGDGVQPSSNFPDVPADSGRIVWSSVVLAAVLMLATLPGRTQGLGLITKPMLGDLKVGEISYANINFWATLIGSAFCLPAGWLLDRFGLRRTTTVILLLFGATVCAMSAQTGAGMLFSLVLLTRALGQSALSVSSITAVGKSAGRRPEMAMAVYSVLLSVFFMMAFVGVGGAVSHCGWRGESLWLARCVARSGAGAVAGGGTRDLFLHEGWRPEGDEG